MILSECKFGHNRSRAITCKTGILVDFFSRAELGWNFIWGGGGRTWLDFLSLNRLFDATVSGPRRLEFRHKLYTNRWSTPIHSIEAATIVCDGKPH